MPLSQAGISEVRVLPDGPDLYVRWDSTAPWGTTYQVYVDRKLSWYGLSHACHVPLPARAAARNVWIEVGTVGAADAATSFSSTLPTSIGNESRALLTWYGGTYLDAHGTDSIQGFRIFMSAAANGSIDYTAPIATISAYNSGVITDGFGLGGYGAGGFGRGPSLYQWQSDPLGSGTWRFAVSPYDQAGNQQNTEAEVSVTIGAAPRPPAANAQGVRLEYSYSGAAQRVVTLSWQPSPS